MGRHFSLDSKSYQTVRVFNDVAFIGKPAQILQGGELLVSQGLSRWRCFSGAARSLWFCGRRGGRIALRRLCEGVQQVGQLQAPGGFLQMIHDGGDAFGKECRGVDGFGSDATNEHFSGASLKGLESAPIESSGEPLRHLKKMFAGAFDGLTEQNEKAGRELLFVDVSRNCDVTHFNDGLLTVVAFEVKFHFLAGGDGVG